MQRYWRTAALSQVAGGHAFILYIHYSLVIVRCRQAHYMFRGVLRGGRGRWRGLILVTAEIVDGEDVC